MKENGNGKSILTKTYGGKKPLFDDISFSIQTGERVGFNWL